MITGTHAIIYAQDAERAGLFPGRARLAACGRPWRLAHFQDAARRAGDHPTGDGAGPDGGPSHGGPPNGHQELYLMCDDIAATMAELAAKGAELQHAPGPGLRRAGPAPVPGAGEIGISSRGTRPLTTWRTERGEHFRLIRVRGTYEDTEPQFRRRGHRPAGPAHERHNPRACQCRGSVNAAEDSKTAAQVWADAKAAMVRAKSLHVLGHDDQQGTDVSVNLSMSPGRGGGSIQEPGVVMELVLAKGIVYVKADEKSWFKLTHSQSTAELVANRWIEAPVTNAGFRQLRPIRRLDEVPGHHNGPQRPDHEAPGHLHVERA